MKSEIVLNLRQFPVLAHDHRTGQEEAITVTVTKDQLRAAQVVGQSSKELVERLCERQGYTAAIRSLRHPNVSRPNSGSVALPGISGQKKRRPLTENSEGSSLKGFTAPTNTGGGEP